MAGKRVVAFAPDAAFLLGIRAELVKAGFEVHMHTGGIGASNVVRANRPDVVLVSTRSPGLSAENLVRFVRTAHPRAKVILWDDSREALRRVAGRVGVAGCVSDPQDLVSELRRLLSTTTSGEPLGS